MEVFSKGTGFPTVLSFDKVFFLPKLLISYLFIHTRGHTPTHSITHTHTHYTYALHIRITHGHTPTHCVTHT